MAKQSGLHQIRGKVGEHSYYRQTGVSSGLIRSINQGMSARVKNAPEYANTRLLNAEFGQACRVAAAAVRAITPKFRPMILPFSQSKMAKSVYNEIVSHAGVWGRRGLNDTEGVVTSHALNALAKNSISDWGLRWLNDPESPGQTLFGDDPMFTAKLAAIGADGVDFNIINCCVWEGNWQLSTGEYATSAVRIDAYIDDNEHDAFEVSPTFSQNIQPPQTLPVSPINFFLVVVLPYRLVDSNKYTLQEHCTFVAIPRNYHGGPLG